MKMLLILGYWLNRHQARKSYWPLVTLTKMLLILWYSLDGLLAWKSYFSSGYPDESVAYSLGLAERAPDSEVIFAFTCLYENILYCRGLAEQDPGAEVIFAFRAGMKMLLILWY
jgi:hypothetical protein